MHPKIWLPSAKVMVLTSIGANVKLQYSIFLGNETKLGMTRGIPEPKLTAVDAMIDKLTGAIFVFQIVVVIVLGTAGNVWKDTEARKVSNNLWACVSWKSDSWKWLIEFISLACNDIVIVLLFLMGNLPNAGQLYIFLQQIYQKHRKRGHSLIDINIQENTITEKYKLEPRI